MRVKQRTAYEMLRSLVGSAACKVQVVAWSHVRLPKQPPAGQFYCTARRRQPRLAALFGITLAEAPCGAHVQAPCGVSRRQVHQLLPRRLRTAPTRKASHLQRA